MGRIKEIEEKMKAKFSLENYNDLSESSCDKIASKPVSQQDSMPAINKNEKRKMTFYLTVEAQNNLNKILCRAIERNERLDKSGLICQAINLFWEKQNKGLKK